MERAELNEEHHGLQNTRRMHSCEIIFFRGMYIQICPVLSYFLFKIWKHFELSLGKRELEWKWDVSIAWWGFQHCVRRVKLLFPPNRRIKEQLGILPESRGFGLIKIPKGLCSRLCGLCEHWEWGV